MIIADVHIFLLLLLVIGIYFIVTNLDMFRKSAACRAWFWRGHNDTRIRPFHSRKAQRHQRSGIFNWLFAGSGGHPKNRAGLASPHSAAVFRRRRQRRRRRHFGIYRWRAAKARRNRIPHRPYTIRRFCQNAWAGRCRQRRSNKRPSLIRQ